MPGKRWHSRRNDDDQDYWHASPANTIVTEVMRELRKKGAV
jgi:hypothetical protein